MPPKKKDDGANAPPPLLGRLGTNLKIGILGLPNVGKSTFFNCLTKSQANAENFPFCTIDPNESRVPVPDARYDFLCDHFKPASKVPAFLNVVDIAGLVKGAHEGKGLGNAFLSNVNACDAMFHVIRAFSDEEIVHVEGDVDPARDLQIIYDELRLKDLEYLQKRMEGLERSVVRGNDKKLKPEYDCLKRVQAALEEGKWARNLTYDAKEIEFINQHLFLTAKPVIYLVNLSEKDFTRKKNKWLVKIKEWIDKVDAGATVILFSCELELKLLDMQSDEERQNYLKETNLQSALDKSLYLATRLYAMVLTSLKCFGQNHCIGLQGPRSDLFFHMWEGRGESLDDTGVAEDNFESNKERIGYNIAQEILRQKEKLLVISAGYQQFLPLSQCFIQPFLIGRSKAGLVWERVKAWTVQKQTKAPQAAGRIHTDMEKGFIMAETMAYEDFKEAGSENACKAAGKYKQKGREYIVEDGDILFIKFNAGAGLKDKKK